MVEHETRNNDALDPNPETETRNSRSETQELKLETGGVRAKRISRGVNAHGTNTMPNIESSKEKHLPQIQAEICPEVQPGKRFLPAGAGGVCPRVARIPHTLNPKP